MAGTFYAREPVSVLYSFVREALRDNWLPFELLGPGGLKLTEENLAFNECGLVRDGTLHRGLQVATELDLSGSDAAHNFDCIFSTVVLCPFFKLRQLHEG